MGLIRYESSWGNQYLSHAETGERENHKYIFKKFENGKWRYYYKDPRKTKEPGVYEDDKGNKVTVKQTGKIFGGHEKITTGLGKKGNKEPITIETIETGRFDRTVDKFRKDREEAKRKKEISKKYAKADEKKDSKPEKKGPGILDKAKKAANDIGEKAKDAFGVDEKERMQKAEREFRRVNNNAKSVTEATLRTAGAKVNVGNAAQYNSKDLAKKVQDYEKKEKAMKEYEKAKAEYDRKPIAATDKISEIGKSISEKGRNAVDDLLNGIEKRKKKRQEVKDLERTLDNKRDIQNALRKSKKKKR